MNSKKPVVSILSITYNQEDYVRQALDGLVMQKTDFAFEVIIADDSSTDKTPGIIREYASNYPTIIKPTLRNKNVGAWPNLLSVLRAAKGQYIAICEGDDYWTNPLKLQTQVDFLENHTDYALCFHPVRVFFEDRSHNEYIYPDTGDQKLFTTQELLKRNFIQTNSVMYRNQFHYRDMPLDVLPADWYLHLYHAKFGKIGFIDEIMSVYRRHSGGLWWDSYKDIDKIWEKFGVSHLKLYVEFMKLYGQNADYKKIINNHIKAMFGNFIEVDKKHNKAILSEILATMPDISAQFVSEQYNILSKTEIRLQHQEKENKDLQHFLELKDQELFSQGQLLRQMKLSSFWKLRNIVARIIGKEVI